MKKKLTSVLLFLALSAGVVSAQTSKVTGKVIGEDGEPVIGASIIVKGTTVGTVTDFDGNFELDRKSTRLNSSHMSRISYAVFCLKKKFF